MGRSCLGYGNVRKGDAEQDFWAGWVWKVASLWLGKGAIIKLWVGFWPQSLLAENKGLRHHCPRGREGAEGRGSGNPETPMGFGSWSGNSAGTSGGHQLGGR